MRDRLINDWLDSLNHWSNTGSSQFFIREFRGDFFKNCTDWESAQQPNRIKASWQTTISNSFLWCSHFPKKHIERATIYTIRAHHTLMDIIFEQWHSQFAIKHDLKIAYWLAGWLAGWLTGCWLAGWLAGCWRAGWLAAGWVAGWLAIKIRATEYQK